MPRIVLVAFDMAQSLDVVGPAEVFAHAGDEVVVASETGGAIRASSGLQILTRKLAHVRPRASDTVIVVGGREAGIRATLTSKVVMRWLLAASKRVRRIGSVCSGAFVLAALGLLDGKRAATHWGSADRLAAYRPAVQVDRNAIFVREGRVWTSAGVTTGIDMALAMVEDDHSRKVADAIAAELVLYARRPGFQSQFADVLMAQVTKDDPLAPVLAWAQRKLDAPLDVEALAKKACMSPRTFHRRCVAAHRTTPAKLVDKLRIDRARVLLSTTSLGGKEVAAKCGYRDAAQLSRSFERAIGMPPGQYRRLFG